MEDIIEKLRNVKLLSLNVKQSYWVDITHINNPNDFYVRLLEHRELLRDLEMIGGPITKDEIKPGAIVVYESQIIHKKVRGIIRDIVRDESNPGIKCNIFAMDYGCVDEHVPINEMWNRQFQNSIGSLIFNCKLTLNLPAGESWTDKDTSDMKILVGNDYGKILVIAMDGITYVVNLYSSSLDDIATLMILTSAPQFDYRGNAFADLASAEPSHPTISSKQLHVNQMLHVRFQYGKTLHSFYVSQINDFYQYEKNLEDFKEYCNGQEVPTFREIVIGHPYAVYLIKEKIYERGIVKDIVKEIEEVEMFLVDRGMTVTVPWEWLKIIEEIYCQPPGIAIHCCARKVWVNNSFLNMVLFPGVEYYINIMQLEDDVKPNRVDIYQM